MGLNHIESHATYVRFLRENRDEVDALFREMLIGVTSFFRDADSFEVLKKSVLPGQLETMRQDGTFRAWIPGCATGEEVYSLAMILRECLDGASGRVNLQLFGTDIDKYAIDKAREGLFPASIAGDLSEERLNRFFVKTGDMYRNSQGHPGYGRLFRPGCDERSSLFPLEPSLLQESSDLFKQRCAKKTPSPLPLYPGAGRNSHAGSL